MSVIVVLYTKKNKGHEQGIWSWEIQNANLYRILPTFKKLNIRKDINWCGWSLTSFLFKSSCCSGIRKVVNLFNK